MSADLETWLAGERRRRWALVTDDDGTIDAFDDLSRRSEPHVDAAGRPFLPRWNPHSAFTPTSSPEYYALPDDLATEWQAYGTRWSMFMNRNPRVWLAWLLGQISETHESASWPFSWSLSIRDWVLSGYETERPFHDRDGVDCPEMREHLTRLAQIGWVVWDEADYRFEWIDAGNEQASPES
ncbi:hypothetical protein [Aureimonas sp. AU40]|uniref:hypothetical protein n=1 Tax=Aureimonas sp. AU40 TaxID=1637747 RepID=UPI0007862B76|nr:hypothetical protein [Aureimonas sp. AU40]